MKSSLLKRSLIVGAVVVTSVAATIPMINAASADVITAAGSDTTENVMGSILSQLNTDANPTYNVPVYNANNFSVQGDSYCPDITFPRTLGATPLPTPTPPAIATPNGSGAGRNALRDYVASTKRYSGGVEVLKDAPGYDTATPVTGCVDIARSSSFSSGSPAATKGQYFAFALDAVSWASPSSKAPATLTIEQLQKIYNCTYTNWNQVGGQDGPIQRYLPQSSSGTRAYFLSDVLGGSSFSQTSADCPAVKVVDKNGDPFEENRGDKIPEADLEKAILPYSAGQWAYQANNSANPSIDQRKSSTGVVTMIKGINRSAFGKTGSGDNSLWNASAVAYNSIDARYQLNDAGWQTVDPAGPNGTNTNTSGYPVIAANTTKESSKSWDTVDFPGVRLVYNVLHTDSPSYSIARSLVGFNNIDGGAKSRLCNGEFKTTISAFGFSPLTTATSSSNLAGSTCRRYLA